MARTSCATTPRPAPGRVLVAGGAAGPRRGHHPLAIEDYSWSADGRQLLVFTNSQPVWRTNTRGDYWTLSLGQLDAAQARRCAREALDADVRQVLAGRRAGSAT